MENKTFVERVAEVIVDKTWSETVKTESSTGNLSYNVVCGVKEAAAEISKMVEEMLPDDDEIASLFNDSFGCRFKEYEEVGKHSNYKYKSFMNFAFDLVAELRRRLKGGV